MPEGIQVTHSNKGRQGLVLQPEALQVVECKRLGVDQFDALGIQVSAEALVQKILPWMLQEAGQLRQMRANQRLVLAERGLDEWLLFWFLQRLVPSAGE